jgi:hypothetical protein
LCNFFTNSSGHPAADRINGALIKEEALKQKENEVDLFINLYAEDFLLA